MNEEILKKIKQIVVECGKIIIEANYDELDIENKEGNNNIVTKYDVLVQNKLKKELLNLVSNSNFIGEENDDFNNNSNEYTFIVDPIDGTTNFSRNIKMSAISVALLKDNNPIIGVCYNPYTNELYEAQKGNGAYLNGKKYVYLIKH